MIMFTSVSWLSAITWKRVIIVVLVLLLASYAVSLKIDSLTYQKDLKALEREKKIQLDIKEAELNAMIETQNEIIEARNVTIDSFDIALTLKDIELNNIHDDVQLLKGDSIAIAVALNRVFSTKR